VPAGSALGVDRSVLLDRLAELLAAHAVERERVLHALGAADHDERPRVIVAQAAEDELGADRDRLGAAAADARHGQRGHGLVEAAAPGHAARAVDRVAVAVLGHAHHDVADQAAVELGVRQGAGDGEAAELRGREPAEQARLAVVDQDVGARRAPAAVEDDNGAIVGSHGRGSSTHAGRRRGPAARSG
jgi:hypothetical protein